MTADAINLTQAGTLSPEDYAQQQALNRQQRFAEMLMGQNQQPQGQMVSGRYVPRSFFEMLQPAANMIAGAYIGKQSDTEAAKLAEKIRLGKATAEESIINKMTGTPEVPAQPAVIPQGQTLRDDNGMLTYGAQQGIAGKPAIKPDLAAALREIRTNQYGAGKEYLPQVLKNLIPEDPTSVQEYKYGAKNPEFALYQREQANLKAPKNVFNMTDIMGKDIGQVKDILLAGQNQVQAGEMSINAAVGEWIGIRAEVDHVVTFPRLAGAAAD